MSQRINESASLYLKAKSAHVLMVTRGPSFDANRNTARAHVPSLNLLARARECLPYSLRRHRFLLGRADLADQLPPAVGDPRRFGRLCFATIATEPRWHCADRRQLLLGNYHREVVAFLSKVRSGIGPGGGSIRGNVVQRVLDQRSGEAPVPLVLWNLFVVGAGCVRLGLRVIKSVEHCYVDKNYGEHRHEDTDLPRLRRPDIPNRGNLTVACPVVKVN